MGWEGQGFDGKEGVGDGGMGGQDLDGKKGVVDWGMGRTGH